MSRIVVNRSRIAAASILLALAGCGGGGVEEGIPADTNAGHGSQPDEGQHDESNRSPWPGCGQAGRQGSEQAGGNAPEELNEIASADRARSWRRPVIGFVCRFLSLQRRSSSPPEHRRGLQPEHRDPTPRTKPHASPHDSCRRRRHLRDRRI